MKSFMSSFRNSFIISFLQAAMPKNASTPRLIFVSGKIDRPALYSIPDHLVVFDIDQIMRKKKNMGMGLKKYLTMLVNDTANIVNHYQ